MNLIMNFYEFNNNEFNNKFESRIKIIGQSNQLVLQAFLLYMNILVQ